MNTDEKSLIVRQANDLIEASYKLPSVSEGRLIRMLIAQIQPGDEDFKLYRISVSDFARVFNIHHNAVHQHIEEAARDLRRREVFIKNGKSWLSTGWLSSAEYKDGNGYVELCFDAKLKPYLLQLKAYYTTYELDDIIQFRSIYSMRFFELLRKEQFKANATGYFKKSFEYEELRTILGIEKEEYKNTFDFKKKVIEPAVKEINTTKELNIIQVDYPKLGRKVSHIVFQCDKPKQMSLDVNEEEVILEEVKTEHPKYIQDLIAFGIDERTAYKWKNKFGIKRINRSIAYTHGMQKAGKIRDNVAGFLARTIQDDISLGWENEQKAKKEKRAEEIRQEQVQREAEEKKSNQDRLEREKVWEQFEMLSREEQEAIIETVTSFKLILQQQYARNGVDSKAVQMEIIHYMKNKDIS